MLFATWVVIHCLNSTELKVARERVDWSNCHKYSEETHYRPYLQEEELVTYDIVYWIADGKGDSSQDPRREMMPINDEPAIRSLR